MHTRQATRQHITALLRDGNFPGLVALAGRERMVPKLLVQFLFAPNDLLCWRAMEGLGHVAAVYPQQVQKVIHRLLYMLNEDSGSTGWGAAAALGEIGRHQVSLVAEFIPMFCGFLEQDFSRTLMLWGVGRVGEVHPELLTEVLPMIPPFLRHTDPQVRAMAAWSLGKARHRQAAEALRTLLADASPVRIYDQGKFHDTTVGRVAGGALEALA